MIRNAVLSRKAFNANHGSHNQKDHGRKGGVAGGGGSFAEMKTFPSDLQKKLEAHGLRAEIKKVRGTPHVKLFKKGKKRATLVDPILPAMTAGRWTETSIRFHGKGGAPLRKSGPDLRGGMGR